MPGLFAGKASKHLSIDHQRRSHILPSSHLFRRHQSPRKQIHHILSPPLLFHAFKLRLIELIPHSQIAPPTPLQITLLEALLATYDDGITIQGGSEEYGIVAQVLNVGCRW
jgi:hypothetical protein